MEPDSEHSLPADRYNEPAAANALINAFNALSQALTNNDVVRIRHLMAANCAVRLHSGRFITRVVTLRSAERCSNFFKGLQVHTKSVHQYGDVAIVTGTRSRSSTKLKGTIVEDFVQTWKLAFGQWQLAGEESRPSKLNAS